MAFLDILRSRKREEKVPKRLPKGALKQTERSVKKRTEFKAPAETNKKEKFKPAKSKKIKNDISEERKEETQEQPTDKTKQSVLASEFILKPHITEQSAFSAKQNVYTFRVNPSANKIIIKKAIKEMYGFEPVKIRVINVPLKKRIVRGKIGIKSGYKKALVYLKEGDKIEFI